MTRTRSNSVGARRRVKQAVSADAPELVDGVNLYERAAPSAQFESMVEAGRDALVAKLQRPVRDKRGANDVVLVEEVSEGARQLDKFRVTSRSPDGFTHDERAALDKLVYRVLPGASATVLFALVDQARYDTRVCCCDLVPLQVAMIVLIYTTALAALIRFVMPLDWTAAALGPDTLDNWYETLVAINPLDPINS